MNSLKLIELLNPAQLFSCQPGKCCNTDRWFDAAKVPERLSQKFHSCAKKEDFFFLQTPEGEKNPKIRIQLRTAASLTWTFRSPLFGRLALVDRSLVQDALQDGHSPPRGLLRVLFPAVQGAEGVDLGIGEGDGGEREGRGFRGLFSKGRNRETVGPSG